MKVRYIVQLKVLRAFQFSMFMLFWHLKGNKGIYFYLTGWDIHLVALTLICIYFSFVLQFLESSYAAYFYFSSWSVFSSFKWHSQHPQGQSIFARIYCSSPPTIWKLGAWNNYQIWPSKGYICHGKCSFSSTRCHFY